MQCGELRWPTLAARPETYTCARCAMIPESKRATRQAAVAKRTRTLRQKAPVAAPLTAGAIGRWAQDARQGGR